MVLKTNPLGAGRPLWQWAADLSALPALAIWPWQCREPGFAASSVHGLRWLVEMVLSRFPTRMVKECGPLHRTAQGSDDPTAVHPDEGGEQVSWQLVL
jgi:hypothetical protein